MSKKYVEGTCAGCGGEASNDEWAILCDTCREEPEFRKLRKLETTRLYRRNHREQTNAYSRQHYANHKSEISERKKEYRANNREKIRERQKRYSAANPDKFRVYNRKHRLVMKARMIERAQEAAVQSAADAQKAAARMAKKRAVQRQYHIRHREDILMYGQIYRATHAETIARRSAERYWANRKQEIANVRIDPKHKTALPPGTKGGMAFLRKVLKFNSIKAYAKANNAEPEEVKAQIISIIEPMGLTLDNFADYVIGRTKITWEYIIPILNNLLNGISILDSSFQMNISYETAQYWLRIMRRVEKVGTTDELIEIGVQRGYLG